MVGMTGFEPATSASRTQRSTKLSHIPTMCGITIIPTGEGPFAKGRGRNFMGAAL